MFMKQSLHGVIGAMMVAALMGSCVLTDLPGDETSTELEAMVVSERPGGAATAGSAEADGQLNGTLALSSDTTDQAGSNAFPCATVISEPHPQRGQRHRSSHNFSTRGCDGRVLQWTCPPGIYFDVKKDITWGTDPTMFWDVTNGSVTENASSGRLYIANPKGARSNFNVSVTAY
jgi:hypothetical protein